ncbi:MAG TPA: aminotransferase class V-fold PLP-dependent enzyme [Anaerolineales bacterium]|nr:aminotransferase class V-fold PLP-dependent enzyme [Anaerolineales bacterium]
MNPDLFGELMHEVVETLKPYRGVVPTRDRLPAAGIGREAVLDEIRELTERERSRWRAGKVSGAVYHGDEGHVDFLNKVYALQSQNNPLHADVWPSTSKFEAEIVAMTAAMLGAPSNGAGAPEVCGVVTSGGTESILLAMKAYRDWGRSEKGLDHPEIVAPTTAHAAFDKAAQYFGMGIRRVPVGPDFRADLEATRAAISPQTVVLVGSAPPFPHGLVDPIEELSELARERALGCHTDACLGGFLLPWAERLGYPVPAFDFRLPGVSSISADTHKYGYAAKGTSVLLYRDKGLRRHQYFSITDWPGGLYFSPTMAGSRPGGLSAACWAAMISMGESGYLEAARRILETAAWIKKEIRAIPDLEVIGDPLFVIAFRSSTLNIYQVLQAMSERGWSLNGLLLPPSVHLCVTLRHTGPGVKETLIEDLRASVDAVRHNPQAPEGVGPVYGLASAVETRGMVREILDWYMDTLYEV